MPGFVRAALVGFALIVVAVLVVKSFTDAPATSPPPSAASQPGTQQMPSPNIPTLALPTELAVALGQQAVPPPPPGAEWTSVLTASGSDSQRTSSFRLTGSTVKLRYNVQLLEGNAAAFFAVFVAAEGQPAAQGGFPDALLLAAGEGEKLVSRPAGSYALNVQSFGCTWTVEVEEAIVPGQ